MAVGLFNTTSELPSLPIIQPVIDVFNWIINESAFAIPTLLSASIILFIGWIAARVISVFVHKTLNKLGLDNWEDKNNIRKALFGMSLVNLISMGIKYYIILIFLNEAALKVNLPTVAGFIQSILVLVPNWVVGIVVLGGALIFGHKAQDKVKESKVFFGELGAQAVYFVIVYFAVVLALPKFGFHNVEILVESFKLIVGGFSAGLAIAMGLSFGLALKDPVSKMVSEFLKGK